MAFGGFAAAPLATATCVVAPVAGGGRRKFAPVFTTGSGEEHEYKDGCMCCVKPADTVFEDCVAALCALQPAEPARPREAGGPSTNVPTPGGVPEAGGGPVAEGAPLRPAAHSPVVMEQFLRMCLLGENMALSKKKRKAAAKRFKMLSLRDLDRMQQCVLECYGLAATAATAGPNPGESAGAGAGASAPATVIAPAPAQHPNTDTDTGDVDAAPDQAKHP